MNDLKKDIDGVIKWLKDYKEQSHTNGYVIGLSGGVDSSVVASLCVRAVAKENVLGVILPIESDIFDEEIAMKLVENLDIKYVKVEDLAVPYRSMIYPFYKYNKDNIINNHEYNIIQANLKSRLRMTSLYMWGAMYHYLVAGTGNKSEDTIGFFTKYGDGGVDILPIVEFYKTEIWKIAEILGDIPQEIIDRPPTDGLWENHNDEDDFGMDYYELDTILKYINDEPINNGGFAVPNVEKIEKRIKQNKHKLIYPPGYKRRK